MAAISMSLSLFSRSLNSSCSLPTPSNSFMALAFSSMPLASEWNFSSITVASAVPSFSLAEAIASTPLASATALRSRTAASAVPCFSMASALTVMTFASASPVAASSAVLASASILVACICRSAACRSASASMTTCSAFSDGRLLGGFGGFDLFDQRFLGLHFGLGHLHAFLPVGAGELLGVLDPFLFLDDRAFDGDAFANHLLDVPFLDLDGLVLFDHGQGHDPLALGGFELAVLLDAFDFHAVGAFLVPLGDDDLAVAVLVGRADLFFGADAGLLGLEPLLLLDDVAPRPAAEP